MTPSNNTISSATLGTTIAIVVAWFVSQCCNIQMSTEVSMALGALVSTFVGYMSELIELLVKGKSNVQS